MAAVLRRIGFLVVRHYDVDTALDTAFRIGCSEADVIDTSVAFARTLCTEQEGVVTARVMRNDRID